MSTEERYLLHHGLSRYERLHERWSKNLQRIHSLQALILGNLASSARPYAEDKDSAREMLAALKTRFDTSDEVRKIELRQLYNTIKHPLQDVKSFEEHCQKWLALEQEARQIPVESLTSADVVFLQDFVDSLHLVARSYASTTLSQITNAVADGHINDIPDLSRLVKTARQQVTLESRWMSSMPSSQAVFYGASGADNNKSVRPTRGSGNPGHRSFPPSPCECGKNHWRSNCYYYNPAIRPSRWSPDQAIQRKITDFLEKNPGIREKIERARRIKQQERPARSDSTNESETPDRSTTESGPAPPHLSRSIFAAHHATKIEHAATMSVQHEPYPLRDSFILDSGTTVHICRDRNRFIDFHPSTADFVYAGPTEIDIEGWGKISITISHSNGTSQQITLTDVAYIPSVHTNLISLRRLEEKGVVWTPEDRMLWFKDSRQELAIIQDIYDQYVVELNPIHNSNSNTIAVNHVDRVPVTLLHQRYGHLSLQALHHIPNIKMDMDTSDLSKCECCHLAFAHQQISRRPPIRASRPYERIHYDIVPLNEAYNGDKQMHHFLDDYTRNHHVVTSKFKGHGTSIEIMRVFCRMLQTQFNLSVSIIHLDNESSFGNDLRAFADEHGIVLELTPPYTPQPNGAIERAGGLLTLRARALQIDSGVPEALWPETYLHAALILNRSPVERAGWLTPRDRLREYFVSNKLHIPAIIDNHQDSSFIRRHGSRVYCLFKNLPRLHKMLPRAMIGYLVGQEAHNIYRVWIPFTNTVIRSRDVFVDETRVYSQDMNDDKSTETDEPDQLDQDAALAVIDAIEIPELSNTIEDHIRDTLPPPSAPESLTTSAVENTMVDNSDNVSEQSFATAPSLGPCNAELDVTNIIEGTRTRKKSARAMAYMRAIKSSANYHAFFAAFAVAASMLKETDDDLPTLSRENMPPPPKS